MSHWKISVSLVGLLLITISAAAKPGADSTLVLDRRYAAVDIPALVKQKYPQLLPFAERILHHAGYHSVSPLALMVLVDDALASEQRKWLNAAPREADALVSRLAADVAAGLATDLGTPLISHPAVDNKTFGAGQREWSDLVAATEKLAADAGISLQPLPKAGEMPLMGLPFAFDQDWEFVGTHTYTGDDDGSPMSSIDFSQDWGQPWDTSTETARVVAAHDGEVQVFGQCNLRISHPSGWSTQYYHLEDIVVQTGQQVKKGQDLSRYADDERTALCQGGFTRAPHVHFALLRDGRFTDINGLQLGEYRIQSGRFSYDIDPRFSWIDRGSERLVPLEDSLTHKAAFNTEIDLTFDGLWFPPSLPGHGVSVMVRDAPVTAEGEAQGSDVAVVIYTYDDAGQANFYAGSVRTTSWNVGETITLILYQSAGGGFSAMRAIDFDDPGEFTVAGEIDLMFDDCANGVLSLRLAERSGGQTVTQELAITRLLGEGCISLQ